eukprot:664302-Heterocapsa_arctica.AAC.1
MLTGQILHLVDQSDFEVQYGCQSDVERQAFDQPDVDMEYDSFLAFIFNRKIILVKTSAFKIRWLNY